MGEGLGASAVAKKLGIGRASVYRALKAGQRALAYTAEHLAFDSKGQRVGALSADHIGSAGEQHRQSCKITMTISIQKAASSRPMLEQGQDRGCRGPRPPLLGRRTQSQPQSWNPRLFGVTSGHRMADRPLGTLRL